MSSKPIDYSKFEPDPEELEAKAGALFARVIAQIAIKRLEPLLNEHAFHDLKRAIALSERAQEGYKTICDGRLAWGFLEGLSAGRAEVLQELKDRAQADKRADILEWLSFDPRPRRPS